MGAAGGSDDLSYFSAFQVLFISFVHRLLGTEFKKLIEAASNLSPRYYYEWATVYYERDRTTKASQVS